MTKLTDKQATFVQEYLVDLNATQAAIRAGYSQRNADKIGSELLGKTGVKSAIQAAMDARAKRTEITQDRVLQELARIAFFDPRTLLNADGSPKPINELDPETAAVVSGMDVMEQYEGSGKEREFIGYVKKVKIADKVQALGLAMRHLGMLRDRTEISGPNGGPIAVAASMTDDELAAIAAKGKA